MIFQDEAKAEITLVKVPYYKIKEFARPYCKINKEKDVKIDYQQTKFEHVLSRYYQDKNLRIQLLHLLEELLEDVFLVVHQQQIKMVYLLLVDEEYVLYVGNMPTTDSHIAILPDKLQHFYKHLHNGWFENISGGLGLLPIEKVRFLSESEWGLPQEILQSTNLNKTYYVLHNGGNGFLCINIEDKENPKALIWWTNDAPKMDIDFWSYLDSWIEIGLSY